MEFIYWFHIVWFSRRKFSNQQKLSKRSFILQYSFAQKTSSYEPQLTQHYKKYTPTRQPKTCFWLLSEKNICTALFLDAQELYYRITCIFLQIFVQNLLFQCIGSFYLVGVEIISIRHITASDFYNVIEYFTLIEIFGTSDILGNLDTSINSIKTLTFSKKFGLQ